MDKKEIVQKEILDFHQKIEDWFKGNTNDKESLLSDMLDNFHPHFYMKGSRGNELDYEGFSNWLPTAFKRFSQIKIEVSEIKIHLTDMHALAEYIETQNADGEINTRKASAVFVLNPDGRVSWYHLLEEWI
ncbi:hypothetical protein CEY12_05735 [Chryseobacterium sp. T16E-39]|uniref:hypothetical protein n=1 Tax=Chryseobacterium sp. T16E-39 TaxID=2015076 RepID=UPI000B5B2589|nr:hypothetical protein [Chryseobacterium sp. T16E-39]ASK29635.1 hypothetical protein CEY12_05735 [Chryseobacterium sp. T16E-39]